MLLRSLIHLEMVGILTRLKWFDRGLEGELS